MKPEELSRQLREESGQYLARRRGIVGLSLVAIGSMALISLYQMGIIKHLPEPPLPYLDADKVDAADEAYKGYATVCSPALNDRNIYKSNPIYSRFWCSGCDKHDRYSPFVGLCSQHLGKAHSLLGR